MPPVLRRYCLWVLLPGVVAFLGAHLLLGQAGDRHAVASAARAGTLAATVFRTEMGERAAELARGAPVLRDPDPASSLIQAALQGDTVAALSVVPGGLLLSVALQEIAPLQAGTALRTEAEPLFRIRATSAPFTPTALNLLRSRTGYGVALYLRGDRVSSEPETLEPESLPPEAHRPRSHGAEVGFSRLSTSMGPGALLPLDPTRSTQSAVHLLVAPAPTTQSPLLTLRGAFLALLGGLLGFGLLSLRIGRLLRASAPPPKTLLLTGVGLPLLGLWLALGVSGQAIASGLQEASRREMVQMLALLKEGGTSLGDPDRTANLQDAIAGTDLELTRSRGGEVLASTLPQGVLRANVAALQPPPPTFPTTGVVPAEGGTRVFASFREESGDVLTLTTPGPEGTVRRLRFHLAALGGAASLLALGFLGGETRRNRLG